MVVLGGKGTALNEPAVSVATTTTTVPVAAGWPEANLPSQTPYGTWAAGETAPPPPGFPQVNIPMCSIGASGDNLGAVAISETFRSRFMATVRTVAAPAKVGELVTMHAPATERKRESFTYTADVTDQGGVGSVQVMVGSFTGTPLQAADEQAFAEFNCAPPKREIRPDGTVLQIYAVHPGEPFQTLTQTVVIYQPNGTQYQIRAYSMGSPDVRPDPANPGTVERVGKGRGTLPLTEGQLAAIGQDVADAS
jgi:hypothetical protein